MDLTAKNSGMYVDGTYLQNNATWHTEDSPWKANQIADILARNAVSPRSVAEVGCGAGEILRQMSLKMLDCAFDGYELSPQAHELSKSRASERVRFFLRNLLETEATYDVLMCIDVFEHVDDYMGFLRGLKSKAEYKVFHIPLDVSIRGLLVGSMMDARHRFGHLHYFTKDTALATLRDCGYEVVDHFYTTYFDAAKATTLRRKLGKIPRKVLYAISPDLMVKVYGGCSLLVLAR